MSSYELYPAAENDLEKIWQYSVDTWGVRRALKYLDDLHSTFQLLTTSPFIGRQHPEFSPVVHIHPHGHHLIMYMVTAYGISVVRILHESMDVPEKLEQE